MFRAFCLFCSHTEQLLALLLLLRQRELCTWSCPLNQVITPTSSLILCQHGQDPSTGNYVQDFPKVRHHYRHHLNNTSRNATSIFRVLAKKSFVAFVHVSMRSFTETNDCTCLV